MAIDRPPRSTPISQYAPPRIGVPGSGTQIRAQQIPRKSSSTWVVRGTPGELPSFEAPQGPEDETFMGLGADLGGTVGAVDSRHHETPTNRTPTFDPYPDLLEQVLDLAMGL